MRRGTVEVELDIMLALTKSRKASHITAMTNTNQSVYENAVFDLNSRGLFESWKVTEKGQRILDAWLTIRREFPYKWLES